MRPRESVVDLEDLLEQVLNEFLNDLQFEDELSMTFPQWDVHGCAKIHGHNTARSRQASCMSLELSLGMSVHTSMTECPPSGSAPTPLASVKNLAI